MEVKGRMYDKTSVSEASSRSAVRWGEGGALPSTRLSAPAGGSAGAAALDEDAGLGPSERRPAGSTSVPHLESMRSMVRDPHTQVG